MTSRRTWLGTASLAFLLAGCGSGGGTATGNDAAPAAAATGEATAATAQQPPAQSDGLVMPPSWMPANWDRTVHVGSGEPQDEKGRLNAQQNMLNITPFILWAVANDTLVTEAFEPIWVWYTAIRSCERGIQMSGDLAGEFGNRERGKAALIQARSELKTWARTQPAEMTLYFPAMLGQWNETTGAFPLQSPGGATTLKPKDIAFVYPYTDGAIVSLYGDKNGQAINYFQASLAAPQCASKDQTKIYKFERMSQWWVVFGDADRGMGGLTNYKTRAMLPPVKMTREQAAALAQRNPERKVVVAVTFVPAGPSFVKGTDQSAIRAKYRQVTVTDALDESVLASQAY